MARCALVVDDNALNLELVRPVLEVKGYRAMRYAPRQMQRSAVPSWRRAGPTPSCWTSNSPVSKACILRAPCGLFQPEQNLRLGGESEAR